MQKHHFVRVLGALAATWLLAGSASATPAKLLADTGFLAGPGSEYDTLASLAEGAKVDVIWCGTTEDWCLVVIHNKKGWVPLAMLNMRPGGGGSITDSSSGGGSGGSGGSAGGNGATRDAGNNTMAEGGNSNAGRGGPSGGGSSFVKADPAAAALAP